MMFWFLARILIIATILIDLTKSNDIYDCDRLRSTLSIGDAFARGAFKIVNWFVALHSILFVSVHFFFVKKKGENFI